MGFTLGSLAVMSGFRPLEPSPFTRFSALFELRSMLLSVVVFFVLLVLAYLTNPSETSFRAFLTEQAFRHHLSRLDDADAQDELESASSPTKPDTLSRRGLSSAYKDRSITAYSSPPFAFANRASVSLRTPKHIFRSFGIFSVAAVVPTSSSNRSSTTRNQRGDEATTRTDRDGASDASASLISDSWFIGAFGMWFWAVNLDGLWKDAGFVAKDEADGTITGVLEIKALDRSDDSNRSSYTPYGNGNSSHGQRLSPKLRSRERFAHQNGNALSHRSQTPPPLPKSASLPLHTKRGPQTLQSERSSNDGPNHHTSSSFPVPSAPSGAIQPPISIASEFRSVNASSLPVLAPSTSPSACPSRSPSTLFASSPLITEILHQISSSQTAISDLHSQLKDFDSSLGHTRNALDNELTRQREHKRADDAAKAELKVQTKALEDHRRVTEAARRDAEKRLKVARSEKDSADARIERLEREISSLQSQMESHGAAIVASGVETGALVADLQEQIEAKRSEIHAVEGEVVQLGSRLREMEEKVTDEERRLENAMAEAKKRKQTLNDTRLYMQSYPQSDEPLLSAAYSNDDKPAAVCGVPQLQVKQYENKSTEKVETLPPSPARSSMPHSPLKTVPVEVHAHHMHRPAPPILAPLDANLANGFSKLNLDFNPHRPARSSLPHKFAPFSSDFASPGLTSPTGESLLPSSLYESLGMSIPNYSVNSAISASAMDVSRSFQSEEDTVLDRNWPIHRKLSVGDVGRPVTFPSPNLVTHTSPVSSAGSTYGSDAFDAFEMSQPVRERTSSQRMELQRAAFPAKSSDTSFVLRQTLATDTPFATVNHVESVPDTSTRRSGWFASHRDKSTKIQEKKGLNPGAKEFSLSKDKERSFSVLLSRSRGSFHGSSSGASSTPSTTSLSTPEPLSLVGSPSLSSATPVKNSSPQTQTTPPARTAGSLLGLGSSWFGGSSRAFAPTPLEREQLSRALGGTANSSLDKLDRVSSLPTSPQPKPALVRSQPSSALSPRLWASGVTLGLGANGLKVGSGFCPFEDDKSLFGLQSGSSSPSDKSTDSGKKGVNGVAHA